MRRNGRFPIAYLKKKKWPTRYIEYVCHNNVIASKSVMIFESFGEEGFDDVFRR